MNHHIVADIDANVGGSRGIISALEEHKVAGANIGRGHSCANTEQTGCTKSADVPTNTAVVEYIGYKARTIKARGR